MLPLPRQLHDGAGGRGLAAATLPDQPQGLALPHLEGNAGDGVNLLSPAGIELDGQIADSEQRL